MEKFEVVAVVAVKGRLPLLKHTIERLLNKNLCMAVVCVGDSDEEAAVCEAAGAHFLYHANEPLGQKWNSGFIFARNFKPKACLFVGSSDWVSDNWLTLAGGIEQFDLIGKLDFHLMDFATSFEEGEADNIRICHWPGYGPGDRADEPIGIGRVISARILDKMNWKPFEPMKNSSLDRSMFDRVKALGGKTALSDNPEYISLSISTNRWNNMHKFEHHWNNALPSTRIDDHSLYFAEFPEAKLIFE